MLLTVAVFLYRGFDMEFGRGPGFRTDHVLLVSFDPDLARYDAAQADASTMSSKSARSAIPGVRSVALTSSVPMDGISVENTAVVPEGFSSARERSLFACARHASTKAISTRSAFDLAGRAFRQADEQMRLVWPSSTRRSRRGTGRAERCWKALSIDRRVAPDMGRDRRCRQDAH